MSPTVLTIISILISVLLILIKVIRFFVRTDKKKNYNILRKVPTGLERWYYRTFLFDIFKKKQSTEFFGKGTKRLEKDKKNKYEKRVYTNSYEKKVFEIYYK